VPVNRVTPKPSSRCFATKHIEINQRLNVMDLLPSLESIVSKLAANGITIPPGSARITDYGDSPELSRSLLKLIAIGRKRAGTSLLWGWEEEEGEPIPCVGDIEIVVDHLNEPMIITRMLSVSVVPYLDVSAEYAAIEGEGDLSLAYWREAHWTFFSRECERLGRAPSEQMPVVCGVFEVVELLSNDLLARDKS
jgi:uncharacterized protein YhfF